MRSQGSCCYVCGSAGFEELLKKCMKCALHIHAYCMETIKEDAIENDWVCEYCQETPKHVVGKFTGGGRVAKRPVVLIPPEEARVLVAPFSMHKGSASCKATLKVNKNVVDRKRWSSGKVEVGDSCMKARKNADVSRRQSEGQVTFDKSLSNMLSGSAWKGSFNVRGVAAPVSILDDVWGHPPRQVGMKAYEFTKKMPSVLYLNAISRCNVWKQMFSDGGPDKDDIGLYILPKKINADRCYSSLVSHLEKQDIILQCSIRGAQLLIFSSAHLNEKSQKIKEAYYLCGLFVDPDITFKTPLFVAPDITVKNPNKQGVLENEQTVDMEIDSLGGAPVPQFQDQLQECDVDGFASPPGFPACPALPEPIAPPGFEDMFGRAPIGKVDLPILVDLPFSSSRYSAVTAAAAAADSQSVPQVKTEKWDALASPPGFPAHPAVTEPRVPPGFKDMLGQAPIWKMDDPMLGNFSLSSTKNSEVTAAAADSQPVVQVKVEKWDGLDFPPGFQAQTPTAEPRVPPGFEETGRIKYKTLDEIYFDLEKR